MEATVTIAQDLDKRGDCTEHLISRGFILAAQCLRAL